MAVLSLNDAVLQLAIYEDLCSLVRRRDVIRVVVPVRGPGPFTATLTRNSSREEIERAVVNGWKRTTYICQVEAVLTSIRPSCWYARRDTCIWFSLLTADQSVAVMAATGGDKFIFKADRARVDWESLFGGEV